MSHEISIIRPDREPLVLTVDDSSYRRREIMGEDELVLNFSLAVYEEIPAGSTVTFEGDTYTLFQSCRVDKRGSRNFEYQATFNADYAYLRKYMFYNWVDKRLSFDLTARPWEHLQMIVDNLNDRLQSGNTPWKLGEGCIESAEKLISYSCNNCMEALQAVADTFETEWEVKGRTIFLRKVEYNADSPLELSYGRGKGLRAGIQRTAYNDETPAARVYIQGGERNIFLSEYGSRELKFPKSYGIGYDGEKYEGEDGYDNAKAVRYVTDDLGQSVAREGGPVNGGDDVALDLTHIYPSHTCEVESVEYLYKSKTYGSIDELVAAYPELADENAEGWDNVQVDVIVKEDAYLPDYSASELQVPGETRQVVFQSGNLASREFDINDYDHKERRFKLVSEWVDGFRMPAGPFYHPSTGNTFIVVGVSLPAEYVSEAEYKALKEAVKYLYEHETQKVTINAEIDPIQAARMWDSWSPKIILGGFVRLTDDDLLAEVSDIRIKAVKQYVNAPTKPVVELSNSTASVSFGTTIRELENQEVHTGELHKDSIQFTKRSFADAKRAIKLIEDAIGDGFEDSIKPATVQTMMMLVGDERLQFAFVEEVGSDVRAERIDHFDSETKTFKFDQGVLKHYTLGINEIRSRLDQKYRYWTMPELESAVLDDPAAEYYVYAFVDKEGDTGEFRLETEPIDLEIEGEEDDGKYHLLMGLLLSERDGSRDYLPLYGFTQIQPGQITTDVIRSADGEAYFDLSRNEIGGVINFKAGSYGELNIGNQNMLRNSGFTGDYLSEPLADEMVMDAAKELYSDPLDHWTKSGTVNVVSLERAVSGKAVRIEGALSGIAQVLYHQMIEGEEYVLSFKAASLSATSDSALQMTFGGVTELVMVGASEKKHVIKIKAAASTKDFSIELFNAVSAVVYDLQLERGTIATAWGNSPFDNSSDRTYYQSLKYLQHALKGTTTQAGGLILSELIRLGNTSNQTEFEEKAGANGIYVDDNSPAFWAGGTMEEAIDLINAYKSNPNAELTDEQIAAMAKFAVTHGGRAILNDMILRGYIHALGGKIGDLVIEGNGISVKTSSNGRIVFTSQGLEARQKDGSFTQLGMCGSQAIMVMGKDAKGGQCYADEDMYKIAAQINAADKGHAIHSLSGLYAGLRPNIRAVYSSATLDALDHTLIVDNGSAITLTLPSSPRTGQEYKLIHRSDKAVALYNPSDSVILDVSKDYETVDTLAAYSVLTLTYFDGIWYAELK